MMEAAKDYSLTSEQEKAFRALERALKKCKNSKIILWDNYGTISAVNGKIVCPPVPDSGCGELLDDMMVTTALSKGCWYGSNADDDLFVEFVVEDTK